MWKQIGKQIKKHRTAQGLTQSDIGGRVGRQKQFISNLENGIVKCSLDKLEEVAKALDCTLQVTFKRR